MITDAEVEDIHIKTKHWEIERMRRAGKATAAAREAAKAAVAPGVTTAYINEVVEKTISELGAKASFLHQVGYPEYPPYPASVCVSVNDEVIHGIPGPRVIQEGDIVKIDVGAEVEGFHGDSAVTVAVGSVSSEAQRLIDVTRECFFKGVEKARVGNRIRDISAAVAKHAEAAGFSVVQGYTGHGIGRDLHEGPSVPNSLHEFFPDLDVILVPGMTICIEPMINMGRHRIRLMPDGWTVKTRDKSLSAHYEHTVLITDSGPELLTE
ncbi:MAG: type I methionyl aminopeptidase [Clostridiales bacterium]|nr:type I methionyl aminopeptidase [Clostridiales bacterium]